MTENTWPDPARPGVPLNPERDGWHWVKARPEKLSALREKVPALWTAGNQHWIRGTYPPEYAAENWTYLGPVLTPDEAAALQKRCEEAERERDALRRDASQEITTDELVRRLQHLGDWQAADRIEALQKRVAELEGALRPFANVGEFIAKHHPDPETDQNHETATLVRHFRNAHNTLAGGKDE